ncbi:MAG: porin family protein [Sphingobacteriaceae bacterium]|nr:porin family protein [Sphingobacteriaceae bacterium]
MKKILLLAVFAVAAFTVSAQTEKGKIMLGGSISAGTSKSDVSGAKSATSFSIMPKAGYFLANNIAAGLGLGYGYDKDGTGKDETISISPFGRDYISLSDQFKFFAELSVPLQFGTSKNAAGDKIAESTSIGAALAPGFAFFPTKKIGIEIAFGGISFQNIKTEDSAGNKIDAASGNSFNVLGNLMSTNVGIQFHF